ncbi:MAG TPA: hypothetical protein VHB93_00240 [Candidatus Paceibacterota bacterium]|nr:hypothetical protein [Candidatus Paceibacterota bacterium]
MEASPGAVKKEQFPRPTVALEDVKTPEDFLNAVDFKTLNDIFDKLVIKSTDTVPARNTGHKVLPERISFVKTLSDQEGVETSGGAEVSTGEIELVWKQDSDGIAKTGKMLKTLMHESTHVRGGYRSEQWEREVTPGAGVEASAIVRKGLQEWRAHLSPDSEEIHTSRIGVSLAEAVTEEIAIEVFREYLLRTGNANSIGSSLDHDKGSYLSDRVALAIVIEVLARKLSLHRDEIWKGFVQAYMNGNAETHIILTGIVSELRDEPKFLELISVIASETTNTESGRMTIAAIANLGATSDALAALEHTNRPFDMEKIKNVLGLR